MSLKFLIDECLSPELVAIAVSRQHYGSTCVRNLGLAGTKDYALIGYVVQHDYTLVTCNSVDFRGGGPGRLGGEHARQGIHAGLVCLNSEEALDLDLQCDLFRIALDELGDGDLVNQALEIHCFRDGRIECEVYPIPEESPEPSPAPREDAA